MIGRRSGSAAMVVLAVACAGALVAGQAAAPARAEDRCAAPVEFTSAISPLPNAAAAIKERRALRVLVVGTGSSTNAGTSAQEASYPQQLEKNLAAALPGVAVAVQTRGGRGLTAADLLPLVLEGLDAFRPDIVIWQSGTVDAVRGLDPDSFAQTIAEGVEKALKRRADVILMDMQFSRFSRATVNYGPYRQALDGAAAANAGAIAFQRYELMRYWAASGQIDLERAPRAEWKAQADMLHACLAKVLTEVIRDGIRQASR